MAKKQLGREIEAHQAAVEKFMQRRAAALADAADQGDRYSLRHEQDIEEAVQRKWDLLLPR